MREVFGDVWIEEVSAVDGFWGRLGSCSSVNEGWIDKASSTARGG